MAIELRKPRKAYAITDNDKHSLLLSASGGAFAVIARAVLSQGGKVYGAANMEDGRVVHVSIASEVELEKLQGSKYVRSNLGSCIEECIKDLHAGRRVLFSGLPCQIAALNVRLQREAGHFSCDNLLTADLICHGAPKQELYLAYLKWLSEKHQADGSIQGYRFRTKEFGWESYVCSYTFTRDGKRHEITAASGDDPYYHAFERGTINQKACYSCQYAKAERIGDFTLGDYWGCKEHSPAAYNASGVSALLVNTDAAERFFDTFVCHACACTEVALEDIVDRQQSLKGPSVRSKEDEERYRSIDEALKRGEIDKIFSELLSVKGGLRAKVRRVLPSFVLRLLYKIRNAMR